MDVSAGRPERIPREDPWELTKPIPLLEDGSFATTAVSTTSDIHYIYVCIKVSNGYFIHSLVFNGIIGSIYLLSLQDKRLGGDEKQKD